MTGEKNRYTTTEKLWKLDDKLLSTPKHDEMVLWLLNKENIINLFNEYVDMSVWTNIKKTCMISKHMSKHMWDLYNTSSQIGPNEIEMLVSDYGDLTKYKEGDQINLREFDTIKSMYNIDLNEYLDETDAELVSTISTTLSQINKFLSSVYLTKEIMELIDISAEQSLIYKINTAWNEILTEQLEGNHYLHKNKVNINIKSEVPITAQNGFLVGYADIQIIANTEKFRSNNLDMYWNNKAGSLIFPSVKYIEVKPTIKSFGETLRQLNTYKHYLHTEDLYLFTTDLRFKDAFESQGIKVLTYPEL